MLCVFWGLELNALHVGSTFSYGSGTESPYPYDPFYTSTTLRKRLPSPPLACTLLSMLLRAFKESSTASSAITYERSVVLRYIEFLALHSTPLVAGFLQ